MESYLESIGTFYDEKIKFLSKKDNLISCNDCKSNKVFKETDKELIFTCGEDTKDKCGIKIHIQLPVYINYENQLNTLKEKLHRGINWKIINQYIDLENDELKTQDSENEMYKQSIKYIEELFHELNMKQRKSTIQKFYDSRIQKTKECQEYLENLSSQEINETVKKDIRIKYIQNIKNLNQEYADIQEYLKQINPFLMTEKPIVKIYNKDISEKPKPKPKQKQKENPKQKQKQKEKEIEIEKPKQKQSISFSVNQRVSWFAKGVINYGNVTGMKGKNVLITNEKGKKYQIPSVKVDIVSEGEPEPQIEEEDKVETKKETMIIPKNVSELKQGDKIIATVEGDRINGYIGKIDKRMKKKVNVILNMDGNEVTMKLELKNIQVVATS